MGAVASIAADDWSEVPVEAFLTAVREPRTAPYWARMEGEVRHMELKSRKVKRSTLAFRMSVDESSVAAQLEFAGRERYRIRQVFADGLGGQQVIEEVSPNPFGAKLTDVGIRPEDLTFGFLYWNFVREEEMETVSGRPCRVLRMRHPKSGDEVQVWVWSSRLAPLRVEWYRSDKKAPYRELRFKGAKERKGFWLPAEIELRGGDAWKSLIKFGKTEIEATAEGGVPADLFATVAADQ